MRCRTLTLLLVALLACTAAPACDTRIGSGPRPTVRDSAGVRIVENTAPRWRRGRGWTLSTEPVLDIGAEDGPPHYAFGFAHGPVRFGDGRIVVADRQTNRMHFYDAAGAHLMSAGGSGEGPGEFTQLYRLRRFAGDSLLALNPVSLTSIFSPEGRFVRRFSLAPVPGRGNIWWAGPLAGGTLLAVSLEREGTRVRPPSGRDLPPGVEEGHIDVPERPPFYRDSLMHFLYTMEGQLIDSIGRLPGQWLSPERALGPSAAYAFYRDAFFHSPGDVVEIRTFRLVRGGTAVSIERIVRRPATADLTVTDQVKERYFSRERARFQEMARRNPGMVDAAAMERHMMQTPFPERMPAHANRMIADVHGNLWLLEYDILPDEPQRWSVFDADGVWLGVVETPGRFTVNEIGDDYVLGVWQDSLDIQHVRMYRLERS